MLRRKRFGFNEEVTAETNVSYKAEHMSLYKAGIEKLVS